MLHQNHYYFNSQKKPLLFTAASYQTKLEKSIGMEARFAQVHLSILVANPVIVPSEQTCMDFFFL